MGVLKAKVDGIWVPVSQGFGMAPVGLVGAASMSASTLSGIAAAATDLPGVSVTWIADPTHTYRTTLEVGAVEQVTTTGFQMIEIGDAANVRLRGSSEMVQAGGRSSYHLSVVESGLSGSQTRKGRASTTSGTVTVYGTGNVPLCPRIVVEDITPVIPEPSAINQAHFESGSYTPVLVSMAIGTGGSAQNTAQYSFVGGLNKGDRGVLTVSGVVIFGTTGATFPQASPSISLPPGFNWSLGNVTYRFPSATLTSAGFATGYVTLNPGALGAVIIEAANIVAPLMAPTALSPTVPGTWAAGHAIRWNVTSEAVRV